MKNKIKHTAIILGVLIIAFASFNAEVCAQNFAQPHNASKPEKAPEELSVDEITENYVDSFLSENDFLPDSDFSVEQDKSSMYTLGTDDVISIDIMRHPEVSGEYPVNGEGNIQYEFVGDISVSGLTKEEASETIKEKLSVYIINPEVTVKIIGYNSKVVYVVGEVGRPGKVFMRGDTITVREALITAGLPMLSAKASKSRLITPANNADPVIKTVNVDKLLYEGDLRENLVMKPGDTLYVPPTLMTKTMRVLQPVAAPIGTAAGTGRTLMTGF